MTWSESASEPRPGLFSIEWRSDKEAEGLVQLLPLCADIVGSRRVWPERKLNANATRTGTRFATRSWALTSRTLLAAWPNPSTYGGRVNCVQIAYKLRIAVLRTPYARYARLSDSEPHLRRRE